MGFAPPPYDGFALLASAHTRMRLAASTFPMLAMNAPYTESQPHATRPRGGSLCAYGGCPVLDLAEKREGPENPYGVVDRSYANFRECPKGELPRIPILGTWVNKAKEGRDRSL
jgi:hypothetical protein